MTLGDVEGNPASVSRSQKSVPDQLLAGSASPSRARKVLRALTVAVAAGIMIFGPMQAIGGSEQAQRFGWHMFARYISLPNVEVRTTAGETENVPMGEIVSGLRIEIDYFAPVAKFLCQTRADALSVHISSQTPQREENFSCHGF